MFRLTFLVAVSLAAGIWAREITETEFMKSCGTVMQPHAGHCCKSDTSMPKPDMKDDIMKECGQLPGKPPSCERELCVASKRGYASPDGTMDKAKQTEMVDKDFSDFPAALISGIKDQCINGDISLYGPPDDCDVMKFGKCVHLQIVMHCPAWDNSGPCEGMADAAAECVKLIETA